jgi:hypothetical protein
MASSEFRDVLSDVGDAALKPAIAKAKNGADGLVDKALKVLEDALDEGDIDAAKVVFKLIGLENQEERASDTHLTVVMPGAQTENVISVKPKEVLYDSIQDSKD